jgi:NADH-quinone oxidoreductase subunit E
VSSKIDAIIKKYGGDRGQLVSILQDIQAEQRYLPREALDEVATLMCIPASQVYSVATFFKAFSLTPRGRHLIKVCLGTACHVRGAAKVVEKMELDLGVKRTQTTPDLKYTLETVNCVGCCALGPMVMIDEEYHGQISSDKVSPLLAKYE